MSYSQNGQLGSHEPTADEVRRQLRRIIESPDFYASERNRRLLQHVVERSLRGEQTKGYEIGTQVFGRPATFDSTKDPIVRIEVSKVRRDLEVYYLKSGRQDPVLIALPKGRYRAVFSGRATEHPAVPKPVAAGNPEVLRACLLGLSGKSNEARNAWKILLREFSDPLFDARVHQALEAVHGNDSIIRGLLLEGLQRAAQSPAWSPADDFATAREA